MSNSDELLVQKINSLPEGSLVRDFLMNYDLGEFEKFLHHRRFGFPVWNAHKCPKCHRKYEYNGDNCDEVDWYSVDTEFENTFLWVKLMDTKYFPCCGNVNQNDEYSDEDAEESCE